MVAPLIIGAARLAAAALAKQAAKKTGQEIAKKTAPKMLKSTESKAMQQKYKYEKDLTQADKKANYERAMKEDKANRASKKEPSSSGYDGVKFDKDDSPYRAGSKMWNDVPF